MVDGGYTEDKGDAKWLKIMEKHCHVRTHKPNWLIHLKVLFFKIILLSFSKTSFRGEGGGEKNANGERIIDRMPPHTPHW